MGLTTHTSLTLEFIMCMQENKRNPIAMTPDTETCSVRLHSLYCPILLKCPHIPPSGPSSGQPFHKLFVIKTHQVSDSAQKHTIKMKVYIFGGHIFSICENPQTQSTPEPSLFSMNLHPLLLCLLDFLTCHRLGKAAVVGHGAKQPRVAVRMTLEVLLSP